MDSENSSSDRGVFGLAKLYSTLRRFVSRIKSENLRKVQMKRRFSMEPISQPAVMTPSIIFLALLAAIVVFIGTTGQKVPLLSNIRVDISC